MSNIVHLAGEIKEYILPRAVSCTQYVIHSLCDLLYLVTDVPEERCLVFLYPEDAGRDSSVGIATCCRLDGLGIEIRCGRDFPHPSRPALGPNQVSLPGVKRPGRGVDHPPHLVPRFKGRIELYLYSPSGSSWSLLE